MGRVGNRRRGNDRGLAWATETVADGGIRPTTIYGVS